MQINDLQGRLNESEYNVQLFCETLERFYATLSCTLLSSFRNFPVIIARFELSDPSGIWPGANIENSLHLQTRRYRFFSGFRNFVFVYQIEGEDLIIFYQHNEANRIILFFASPDERFLIVGDAVNVFLLEVIDGRRIEERDMRRQTITYALFATDSTICVTFSDTIALIWDLHQRQCIASVNLELY